MILIIAGLVLLVTWPLYNLTLVWTSARAGTADRRRQHHDAGRTIGHEPREFWIVIPCLNEERVIGRTVAAALALPTPPGTRRFVLVVDDASDDGTPAVLAAIRHPELQILRREAPDAKRGKGEALNAAYHFIRTCATLYGTPPRQVAIGVIDGDGRGSPNILSEVRVAMRDLRVGAVQCRVRIHNRDRVLGAVQDLEFGCIANASQVLRNRLGTVGLGGNGQFTRLSALLELGPTPWSSCLVEDLELGLRLRLARERIRYVSAATVAQQGVVDVRRLLRQRTRWAQGNLQCVRYVPRLIASRDIGNAALIEMLYYLLAPWLNAAGTGTVGALWGYAIWRLLPGHGAPFLLTSWAELAAVVVIWAAAMLAPPVTWAGVHRLQLRDERIIPLLGAAVVYPGFLMLGLASTVRAIARQATGRNAWAKTERLAEAPTLAPPPAQPVPQT
ncbi:MAG: glycosyltransferase [Dactylosporangium sp.]|nr:glycosyltransferase [Dactylosporangium sp.]NNJ59773.1 glycosyltransferase [Dactylosporangium sp.]